MNDECFLIMQTVEKSEFSGFLTVFLYVFNIFLPFARFGMVFAINKGVVKWSEPFYSSGW